MTNLRDLLNDFAQDLGKIHAETEIDSNRDYEAEKEDLIDEYIEIIKNRIVG